MGAFLVNYTLRTVTKTTQNPSELLEVPHLRKCLGKG